MAGNFRGKPQGKPAPKPAPKPKGDKPALVVRHGAYKLSAWANQGERGEWFSCKLARVYKVGEEWRQTDSFNDSDLLSVAELCRVAFTTIGAAAGKSKIEWLDGRVDGEVDAGTDADSGNEGEWNEAPANEAPF